MIRKLPCSWRSPTRLTYARGREGQRRMPDRSAAFHAPEAYDRACAGTPAHGRLWTGRLRVLGATAARGTAAVGAEAGRLRGRTRDGEPRALEGAHHVAVGRRRGGGGDHPPRRLAERAGGDRLQRRPRLGGELRDLAVRTGLPLSADGARRTAWRRSSS